MKELWKHILKKLFIRPQESQGNKYILVRGLQNSMNLLFFLYIVEYTLFLQRQILEFLMSGHCFVGQMKQY